MMLIGTKINLKFINNNTIEAKFLNKDECRYLIKEQNITSNVPNEFHDLFPQGGTANILDEDGNITDTIIIPKPDTLSTEQLLVMEYRDSYVFQQVGTLFYSNKVLDINNFQNHSAILYNSQEDFRKCYRKTNVSLNEHNDIIISTVNHDLDKATLNNFLRSNEAQLLAAFTDEYYKAYALKDGYYLVVHYDREKPSTSLFNDYEAFKDYVAILPPLV